jgi:hypothetical protein
MAQREARFGRVESFSLVILAYLVALAPALWIAAAHADARPYATLFWADVVATLVVYGFSIVSTTAACTTPTGASCRR